MIRGLWFFLQLAVLVVAAVWLAEQPGSVSIQWRGWLVETSAGVLILLVIVLAMVLRLVWRLWRTIGGTPHLIGRFRRSRRRNRGYVALVRSLAAIAGGEGAVALRHASEAEEIGEPVVAHLAAAEAAELAGDMPRAEAEYRRLEDRPDTALIGLRGLIGLAERRGDFGRAKELAAQARRTAPKSPWAARKLFELECKSGAFADAEKTLSDAAKLGAFPSSDSDKLLAQLLFARGAAADAAGRSADALADAGRAHELDPGLTAAGILAAGLLARAGRIPAAERVLERAWAAAPDSALARAWMGLAPAGDVTARLRQAERLYAANRNSAEGRLTLAEAELAAGRWAEARAHLSALSSLPVTRRYCRLMAYLESASGNNDAARSWFDKSIAAPPDGSGAEPRVVFSAGFAPAA